jgi:hypothetical protein
MPSPDTDTSVINGHKSTDTILTPEEAKALHTKLNKFYRQQRGDKKRAKPVLKPIGDVDQLQRNLVIQKSPTDWDDIPNGALFAVDPAGSLLFTKVSASRALCLNFMKTQPVGGASCYRIFV